MNLSRRKIFSFVPAGIAASLIAPRVAKAANDNIELRDTVAAQQYIIEKLNNAVAANANMPVLMVRQSPGEASNLLRPEVILKEIFSLTRPQLEFKPILVKQEDYASFLKPRFAKATMGHMHVAEMEFSHLDLQMPLDKFRQIFIVPAAKQLADSLNSTARRLGVKSMRIASRELPGGMDWSEKIDGRGMSITLFRGYDIRENRMFTSAHVMAYMPNDSLSPNRLPS
jgi:hypothetical protein